MIRVGRRKSEIKFSDFDNKWQQPTKTDKNDIKWQQLTKNDNNWQKMTTDKNDNK